MYQFITGNKRNDILFDGCMVLVATALTIPLLIFVWTEALVYNKEQYCQFKQTKECQVYYSRIEDKRAYEVDYFKSRKEER